MEYKDYYGILGVSKDASDQEIKKAYRKLARKYHPDANPDDKQSEERFKEINEAHEVLSDPEKRRMYDQFGSQWQQYQRAGGQPEDFWQQWSPNQPGAGRGNTRTVSPEEFEQMFGGGGMGGFSDFFETLFGGRARQTGGFDPFSGQAASPGRSLRGRDLEHPVEITLEEAFQGTARILDTGSERLEVTIPPGVDQGSRVRVAGKGAPGANQGRPGDLYLRITVLPHPTFQREGDSLRASVPIDLYTLILGGEAQVPTLDRPLVLTIPAETPNGKVFRLRGQGMPSLRNPDRRGDLYATVEVQLPRDLSERERELFQQLRNLRSA